MDDFDAAKTVEVKVEDKSKEDKKEFNFMDMLDNPLLKGLMESGKDIFKKEKPNPDTCKITIEAPSEVVLKLFRVE